MRGILLVFAAILLLGCVAETPVQEDEEIITDTDCPGCYDTEDTEDTTEETTDVMNETEEETNETEEIEEPINETVNETVESGESEYPDTGCFGPSEYDMFASDYVVMNGTRYNDSCVTSDVAKKYYCVDDVMKTINDECPPGYICKFGACEEYEGTCEDSDGNDILIKGRVVISEAPFATSTENDECYDEGTVKEWLCNYTEGYYELILCGSGKKCENGRCVKSQCKETDGGNNPEIEGEVETEDGDVFKDDCLTDKRLKEYYCHGERAESEIYECVGQCRSDACTLPGFEG